MYSFGSKAGIAGLIAAMVCMEAGAMMKPMNEGWVVVNDGVMGGLSQSKAEPLADGSLRFTGRVSFENNGGFASIRRSADFIVLDGSEGITLRVKGDGKTYQLRVRTSERFDGVAYKHDFTAPFGEWSEVKMKWTDFSATFRGRRVPGAPDLKAAAIKQIGILIADKQEGPFEVLIERVALN